MTMQQLNIGSAANDGSGEDLRSSGVKINANFAEAEARMTAAQVTANAAIPATQKGAANGVATLNSSGQVPAAQLPSYVDDVLEFATLAALPAVGESGKIYIAVNGGDSASNPSKEYRWTGSAYMNIPTSPGTTDNVAEGTTNLYFSQNRVRATLLTGLSLVTSAVVAAADTVIVALGKLQAQITSLAAKAVAAPLAVDNTTDLNTLITAGWQPALYGGAPGSRNPNHPDGQNTFPNTSYLYWIEVLQYGTSVVQIAHAYSGNDIPDKYRSLLAGVWTPWSNRNNWIGKNFIINGEFNVWQRANTQTNSGYGSADRWLANHNGSTKTVTRFTHTYGQADVLGNPTWYYRTVVSSVAGTTNFVATNQRIEDVKRLGGITVAVSFYAKADAAKNIALELSQGFGTGGSPSATVTGIGAQKFLLSTAWQKFTATVTLPSIAGMTLGSNNDSSTVLTFWFDSGSSYNSRTASLGQQSGTFDISNVKLEIGSVATGWEPRSYAEEFVLSQRYYQQVFVTHRFYNYSAVAAYGDCTVTFPVSMRNTPAVSYLAAGSTNNVASTTLTVVNNGYARLEVAASTTVGDTYVLFATYGLDAEL